MASHLTTRHVELIVSLIDSWPGGTRLTWDELRVRLRDRLPSIPTRQALARHHRIKVAFDTRKKRLRVEKPTCPANLEIAAQEIRQLKAKNARLYAENQALLQRFARWLYNAYKHGVTPLQLDEDCP